MNKFKYSLLLKILPFVSNKYEVFGKLSLRKESKSKILLPIKNGSPPVIVMCPTAESIRRNGENYYGDELIRIAKYFPNDVCHITQFELHLFVTSIALSSEALLKYL